MLFIRMNYKYIMILRWNDKSEDDLWKIIKMFNLCWNIIWGILFKNIIFYDVWYILICL